MARSKRPSTVVEIIFGTKYSVSHSCDDVMTRTHVPHYWPFVWGIQRWLVDSPLKATVTLLRPVCFGDSNCQWYFLCVVGSHLWHSPIYEYNMTILQISQWRRGLYDLIHKSQNAPVPYPTMPHSEQKCVYNMVCSALFPQRALYTVHCTDIMHSRKPSFVITPAVFS